MSEPGMDVDIESIGLNGHTLEIIGVTVSRETYYVGDDLELRCREGNCDQIRNIIGNGIEARKVSMANGPVSDAEYFVKNHLGSTMTLIDEDGQQTGPDFDYFAYGKQEDVTVSAGTRVTQTFTGKELDLYESDEPTGEDGEGLYYFGKRYYDGEVGRWTAVDPTPQYFDLFNYCGENPISKADPDGAFDFSKVKDDGTRANLMRAAEIGYNKLYEGDNGIRTIDKVYSMLGANNAKSRSGIDAQLKLMFTNGKGPAISLGAVKGGYAEAIGTGSIVIDNSRFLSMMTTTVRLRI